MRENPENEGVEKYSTVGDGKIKIRLRDVLAIIAVMLNFTMAATSSMLGGFLENHIQYHHAGECMPSVTEWFRAGAQWYWAVFLVISVALSVKCRKYYYSRLCLAFAVPMFWFLVILGAFTVMHILFGVKLS